MTGFEPGSSPIESDRAVNCATTTSCKGCLITQPWSSLIEGDEGSIVNDKSKNIMLDMHGISTYCLSIKPIHSFY